jgi:hypothetical protein
MYLNEIDNQMLDSIRTSAISWTRQCVDELYHKYLTKIQSSNELRTITIEILFKQAYQSTRNLFVKICFLNLTTMWQKHIQVFNDICKNILKVNGYIKIAGIVSCYIGLKPVNEKKTMVDFILSTTFEQCSIWYSAFHKQQALPPYVIPYMRAMYEVHQIVVLFLNPTKTNRKVLYFPETMPKPHFDDDALIRCFYANLGECPSYRCLEDRIFVLELLPAPEDFQTYAKIVALMQHHYTYWPNSKIRKSLENLRDNSLTPIIPSLLAYEK